MDYSYRSLQLSLNQIIEKFLNAVYHQFSILACLATWIAATDVNFNPPSNTVPVFMSTYFDLSLAWKYKLNLTLEMYSFY